MQSLLDKVKEVEKEAVRLTQEAEMSGSEVIASMQANESSVLAETKARAEARAQSIIGELVSAAKEETNKRKQEKEQSLAAIASAAESNREAALTYAFQKFMNLFVGK